MRSILETVGKAAGIGGIAFGVFLILIRAIINRVSWPAPTKKAAESLLRLIIVLSFSLSALGVFCWFASTLMKEVAKLPDKGGGVYIRLGTTETRSQSVFALGEPPSNTVVIYWDDAEWAQKLTSVLKPGEKVPREHVYGAFLAYFKITDSPQVSKQFDAAIAKTKITQMETSGFEVSMKVFVVSISKDDLGRVFYELRAPVP
jgi:hypothetical protein